jgi:phage portal protein BeeE
MGMIDRLRALVTPVPVERSIVWPPALPGQDNYLPWVNYGGSQYGLGPLLQQTLQGTREEVGRDFEGLTTGAYQGNGVVFTCLNARMALFKQARFMYRQLRSGTPGDLFSTPDLDILREPWANGTTSDLLARMIQDADLGGNSFKVRRPGRILRLRPDWTVIIHGSANDADVGMWDPEAELLGYAYQPGGPAGRKPWVFYQPSEVAHFAPIPDPLAPARGMSWLTPLVREIEADSAMTAHKLAYMRNGATPNLVVTGVPAPTPEKFRQWVDELGSKHDGIRNAYKTMYLTAGVTATVVGNDLAQVDFKVTQGAGETRIAAAAGVPPIVAGLSEGLQGSSLNAGNFQAAMRRFADLTGRSLWEDAAGALGTIVARKPGAELWYDDRYIPALKDDIKDAAEVQQLQAAAIRQYVDAGFEPDSVVDAVNAGDLKRLKHSGLYSVQLQPAKPEQPPAPVAPEPARGLFELLEAAERRALLPGPDTQETP